MEYSYTINKLLCTVRTNIIILQTLVVSSMYNTNVFRLGKPLLFFGFFFFIKACFNKLKRILFSYWVSS